MLKEVEHLETFQGQREVWLLSRHLGAPTTLPPCNVWNKIGSSWAGTQSGLGAAPSFTISIISLGCQDMLVQTSLTEALLQSPWLKKRASLMVSWRLISKFSLGLSILFCVRGLCLHEGLGTTCGSGAYGGKRRASALDSLEMQLQMVIDWHLCSGNWALVLWKNKYSWPLSLPSSCIDFFYLLSPRPHFNRTTDQVVNSFRMLLLV